MPNRAENGSVKVTQGLFRRRMDVNKRYLLELDSGSLLKPVCR